MPGLGRWGNRGPRCGSPRGAGRAGLPAVPPAKHHGRREEHDLQVFERGAVADVFEIIVELFANVLHARVIRLIDLGPARDPGQDALTPLVFLYLLPQLCEDGRLFRPWAHDVHIAHQNVPELGQLIQPELAQYASHGGDARILALRPYLWGCSAVDPHRAKLVHTERAAPVIGVAPRIAGRVAKVATIDADSP